MVVSSPGAVDVQVSKEQAAATTKGSSTCETRRVNGERVVDLLELQQRPEDAAVSSDGAVGGVDGEHVALRRPQD